MKLETKTVEKVWGRCDLPEPFTVPGKEPIGEIWFEPPSSLSDILVKYLFTSEKLSVQVHPSDDQAPTGEAGKEECWLILHADADAKLAIGFKKPVSEDEMKAAALDGSIEDLLEWHAAQSGDFFYLPAGTVHAIGPGLTLVEVQQNSDITYRLYDYGRPRELHLDDGLKVAKGEPYPARLHRKTDKSASEVLVDGPHFRFSQCRGAPQGDLARLHTGPVLVLPLEGEIMIGDDVITAGECGEAESLDSVGFQSALRTLLVSGA
ncbi:class I mannose-6-phosphate isomerase [Qipengyuania sp.]|uniref:class I mannose-6-phosphate isomerase n=1 Tax=Qipengyuania sp. TaxID=2004515 RepID=UPI0035C7BABD